MTNLYGETPERVCRLVHSVDSPDAEAVFPSGVGMPTIEILQALEQHLKKPVVSAASAMMWNEVRTAGVTAVASSYGRLLASRGVIQRTIRGIK